MREIFLNRINELKTALEQTAMSHHNLSGRLAEVVHLLEEFDKINKNPDEAVEGHVIETEQ